MRFLFFKLRRSGLNFRHPKALEAAVQAEALGHPHAKRNLETLRPAQAKKEPQMFGCASRQD